MEEKKTNPLFTKFIAESKILIVDKSSASRRRLTKTLVDLGASRTSIFSLSHYSEAVSIIKKEEPNLVLSDFTLSGGSGFELFREYKKMYPKKKDCVLVLVTSNISQSAVAQAAEEDVDSFIIKPYTVKSLHKSLETTILQVISPGEYLLSIQEGKLKLDEKDFEGALEAFERALTLSKKPTLAHYYIGYTKYIQENLNGAESNFKLGLEINHIHYKCQIGLYEILLENEKYHDAYEVVKKISEYFPSNPERLKEVVRLAVVTKNYKDIEDFYEIFKDLDTRSDEMIRYISSGLYVCGKYYFQIGSLDRGRKIFEKIGVSCQGKGNFLKEMIRILVQYSFFEDAQRLLARFPIGGGNRKDYQISCYLAESIELNPTEKASRGLDLYNSGVKDPLCVNLMIDAMSITDSDDKAKFYLEEAKHTWPEIFDSKVLKVA